MGDIPHHADRAIRSIHPEITEIQESREVSEGTTMTTSLSTIYSLLTAWHNDRLAEQWGNECQRSATPPLDSLRSVKDTSQRLGFALSWAMGIAVLEIDVKRRVEEHQWDDGIAMRRWISMMRSNDSRPFYRAIIQDISGNRDIFTDDLIIRTNTKQRKVK